MIRVPESSAMSWLGGLGVFVPALVAGPVHEATEGASGHHRPKVHFGPPWVVKPDVAIGGKGLKGLVHVCSSEEDLSGAIREVADWSREEFGTERFLIEEYIEGPERYISVAMDEEARAPILRVGSTGGVGFRAETAALARLRPGAQVPDHVVNEVLDAAGFTNRIERQAMLDLALRLTTAFMASEATLLEINPIRWTGTREVAVGVACEFDPDGRTTASGFRPDAVLETAKTGTSSPSPTVRELLVAEANEAEPHLPAVSFVEMDRGDVALLVSGGGGSLLCFDYLTDRGVHPACYMDSSPGAGVKKRTAALAAGLSVPGIRGALIGSVVVSLADVTESSKALLGALDLSGCDPAQLPIVVRLAGPKEEAAREALEEAVPEVHVVGREHTLEDCCDLLISLTSLVEPETGA